MVMNNKQIFLGHLTMDDIIYCDGTTYMGVLGGAALYAAVGASVWGGETYIVSKIGQSYNYAELCRIALDRNINIDNIKFVDSHGLDIWVLYDKNNDHYFIPKYYSGKFDEIIPTFDMIPDYLLNRKNIFHISPMPICCQKELITYLRKKGCSITVDPHQESCKYGELGEWEYIFKSIDVFFPSEIEFRLLSGDNMWLDWKCIAQFSRFYKIPILVLKMAEKGACMYLLERDEMYYIPAIRKQVTDCTGAGDAFAGGFIYSYIQDLNPVKALLYATVSAAKVMGNLKVNNLIGERKASEDFLLSGCRKSIQRIW